MQNFVEGSEQSGIFKFVNCVSLLYCSPIHTSFFLLIFYNLCIRTTLLFFTSSFVLVRDLNINFCNKHLSPHLFTSLYCHSTHRSIPKSANHKQASTNYRPSKMLERHFHHYITKHLNDHHPLSNKQWGFQSGKSTVAALFSVTHDLFQELKSGQEVCSSSFFLWP